MVTPFDLQDYERRLDRLMTQLTKYEKTGLPGRSQLKLLIFFATHEKLSAYNIFKLLENKKGKMAYKNVHKVVQRLKKDGFIQVVNVASQDNLSGAIHYQLSNVGIIYLVLYKVIHPAFLLRYYSETDALQLTIFTFFEKRTFEGRLPDFLRDFLWYLLHHMVSHILLILHRPVSDARHGSNNERLARMLINQASKELLFLFSESPAYPDTLAILSKDQTFLSNADTWSNVIIEAREAYSLN